MGAVHNPHQVLTEDGEYHRITWHGKTGEKEVYLVKTKAGYELKATENHKFLTINGWKEVRELDSHDKLVLQKNGKFGAVHVDRETALMLGWLVGDGHMSAEVQDVIFYFGTKEKEELLPLFKSYLDRLNGKEVVPKEDKTETRLKYSSKIARMFYDLGLRPLKAHEKEVPTSVFKMDQESVRMFLSALFTADGSVQGSKEKGISIRLSSNSIKLLKQVQVLLLQFGIVSRIHEERRPEHKKMLPDSNRQPREYSCRAQHELIISRESMFKFMDKIGFAISSKTKRFEELKPTEVYSDDIDTSIDTIEKCGVESVYDLTEPVTHSFSANGLIVHNCGEVPMPDYESCNLGSINLVKFVELDWSKTDWKKKINWKRLRYVVRVGFQFLDNVIDLNKYPIQQIRDQTLKNRRIGLGVMGFARMLFKMGIRYDSVQGYEIGEHIMKFIESEARQMSHELGRARGSFPSFQDSIFAKKYDAMRNATCSSIAPTGTISMIADTSSGIEPVFALSFLKTVRAGQYYYCDEIFEHVLKVRGLYSQELMQKVMEAGTIQHMDEIPEDIKNVFRVAHDMAPDAHVLMQAAFQKNVGLAVSKTINMPADATVEDVEAVYLLAWKNGCKGITIYRDSSRQEQVLHVGKTVKTKGVEEDKFKILQQQVQQVQQVAVTKTN
jgi:ribonucleoside-diphosphate reductase alpha chain